MSQEKEYSTHPHYHLVNGMYNWIVENGGVPYVVVPLDAVPAQLHRLGDPKTGTIVLNIAPHSTGMFSLEPEHLSFRARFQGVDTAISFHPDKVLAIYDRDTPQVVMQLPLIESAETESETPPVAKRPTLSVVK